MTRLDVKNDDVIPENDDVISLFRIRIILPGNAGFTPC